MKEVYFSIIVPAYNASCYIEACLDCVIEQSYQDYEIIIVNDGSSDDTENKVKSYINNHKENNVVYIFQENKGAAGARGTGVEAAKGKYIAFLDADDFWYPKKLERMKAYIEQTQADVLYHDEYEVSLDGRKKLVKYRQLDSKPLDDLIINGNALSTSTVVVRSEVLKENNTFKEGSRAGEDIQCWVRLAQVGASFFHIDEALGEYRRTASSLTLGSPEYVRQTNKMLVDFYELLDKDNYTTLQIEQMKKRRITLNAYIEGRCYHASGMYADARKKYIEAMNKGLLNIKVIAMFIMSLLHIKR